jgi:hypothetical protein
MLNPNCFSHSDIADGGKLPGRPTLEVNSLGVPSLMRLTVGPFREVAQPQILLHPLT